MDRFRKLFFRRTSYEPLEDVADPRGVDDELPDIAAPPPSEFSWIDFTVFLLLGNSMLWAWNMFLAATPYFRGRFDSNEWTLKNFQSSIISVFSITNLICVLALAKLQKNASYPKRITLSLFLNVAVFCILAVSTSSAFSSVSSKGYFGFLMVMVFGASAATGTNQNGVYSYCSGFNNGAYTQAVMIGQGIAGVLPGIIQIASVLAIPERKEVDEAAKKEASSSAFIFFMTAAGVSAATLIAFAYLMRRHKSLAALKLLNNSEDEQETPSLEEKRSIPLWTIFKKLPSIALAILICFLFTMMYPVFTGRIESVQDGPKAPRLFHSDTFIPFAFLAWNIGDLIGRVSPSIPQVRLSRYPWALLLIAIARAGFFPLYLLCNIDGRGAVVKSDAFYLIVIQIPFGILNGYLNSSCMMEAPQFVADDEKEATGGFMSFMLVTGLTSGSLLSFSLGEI
ncbi:hypothetical protein FQN54_006549 [Arachnomyces sp. PD_36]|nr:hypothetical protein FQN54_006549 [Arachnomyces sp. PD_36]